MKTAIRYLVPIILSLPFLFFPSIGNGSLGWGNTFIIFGYFWVGIAIGEHIGKSDL